MTESPTLAELLRAADSPTRDKTPSAKPPLLACEGLFKTYRKGPVSVPVLQGVDLSVAAGEFVAVVGQSGSGKSTLLHLLGALDKPDDGRLFFDGRRVDNLPGRGRDTLRNRQIGMVFQSYHLLPELTAVENVLAPAMIRHGVLGYWRRRSDLRRRAHQLLDQVGLDPRAHHKPRELSGGEMQRAAIARSLMSSPRLLLADEPTGNLDHRNGGEVLSLLERLHHERGLTVVMVTHDRGIAARADRTVTLAGGRVQTGGPAGRAA